MTRKILFYNIILLRYCNREVALVKTKMQFYGLSAYGKRDEVTKANLKLNNDKRLFLLLIIFFMYVEQLSRIALELYCLINIKN